MKKKITVKFVDFSSNNIPNIIINILRKYYEVIVEDKQPEYLFYSVFGHDNLKYEDSIRIFWTGENVIPDFNICDYAIGFAKIEFEDRYKRVPLYYFYKEDYKKAMVKNDYVDTSLLNRKFCNYIYSNGNADPSRDYFFKELSKYKNVDSGGRHLNNIGESIDDKLDFQSKYKFSIAFENSSANGYVTEKILQAFAARTIPIYWGDSNISDDFNTKAFINCHDYDSFDDVIQKIIEIDNDDDEYIKMMMEPFKVGEYSEEPLWEFESFLHEIIDRPLENCRRRAEYVWPRIYFNQMRELYIAKDAMDNKMHNTNGGLMRKIISKQWHK